MPAEAGIHLVFLRDKQSPKEAVRKRNTGAFPYSRAAKLMKFL